MAAESLTEQVQIGWFVTEGDDEKERARVLAAMGPFLSSFSGLTPDSYWALTLDEWAALYWWLVETGVVADGES